MITDFKLPVPYSLLLSGVVALGSYMVGTHTSDAVMASRVDQLEKSLTAEQIVVNTMISRNEFQLFREEQNSRLADILSRLKDIDSKVSH